MNKTVRDGFSLDTEDVPVPGECAPLSAGRVDHGRLIPP
jgi:hypothetical protein